MAGRRKLTNPLGLAVLAFLMTGPMHPYQIARVLKYTGKDDSIKIRYGSLYTVVQDLEKRGFIEAEGTARAGHRPERTVYRLTADGRREVQERLRELMSEPVKEYPVFAAVLSLVTSLHPDEVPGLLRHRLSVLEIEIASTRAAIDEAVTGQGLPRLFVLETEYMLAMKRAEAEWVRGLLKELADGSLADVKIWRTVRETGKFPEELLDADWAKGAQEMLSLREADEPE
ncbi:MAG TPA: PadR family transcriptional regulator [Streptosporangiaceae bacterium]|nr:PadR family transcriptional regulator [Streptosporangiaceae bacterium]